MVALRKKFPGKIPFISRFNSFPNALKICFLSSMLQSSFRIGGIFPFFSGSSAFSCSSPVKKASSSISSGSGGFSAISESFTRRMVFGCFSAILCGFACFFGSCFLGSCFGCSFLGSGFGSAGSGSSFDSFSAACISIGSGSFLFFFFFFFLGFSSPPTGVNQSTLSLSRLPPSGV